MALPPQAPPPPADTGPDSIVIDHFTGIKNTVEPERLKPEELQQAVNVDLDDVGQLHRRRGVSLVSAGSFASLFTSDSGVVYGVHNSVLGIINPDYSFVPLQTGIGPNNLAYVQIGSTIYFSSMTNSGKIDTVSNTVSPWGIIGGSGEWISPVVNPTPTLPAIHGKLLGPPPMASYLTYFNGRIYMASGNAVWCTDLYLYDYVDRTRTFIPFTSEVSGLGTVSDGIYAGTVETGTWFCSGPRFEEFKRTSLMDANVIPGSMISIPAELMDPHNQDQPIVAGNGVAFLSTTGLCIGRDAGQVFNITQTRVWFPDAETVVPMWRRQDGFNSYVGVLDSGGGPSDNARVGDYVDATIVRFKN